jgi:hypothetical protein
MENYSLGAPSVTRLMAACCCFVSALAALALGTNFDTFRANAESNDAEDVQSYAAGDPYVVHGLVKRFTIRPWNVVLSSA